MTARPEPGRAPAPVASLGVAWLAARLGADSARASRRAGGVERLWGLPAADLAHLLARAPGLEGRLAAEVVERTRRGFREADVRAALHEAGIDALPGTGPSAPRGLRDLADPPSALFARGQTAPTLAAIASAPVVAIVGSRRPGSPGLALARSLACALAERGAVVVSGLALGIDAAAHQGSLDAGGRTVAVLGGGVDRPSPRRNLRLAESVVRDGLLLSEYWPGTLPAPWRFPARNRIVAAISDAVVVVEAGARSGALITADLALDIGRPVLAVPGSPWLEGARGCNELIRSGAAVCEGVDDVVAEIPGRPWTAGDDAPARPGVPLSTAGHEILRELGSAPGRADELAERLAWPAARVASTLAVLEIEGRVIRAEGQRYWAAPSAETTDARARPLSPCGPVAVRAAEDAPRSAPERPRHARQPSVEATPARTEPPPPGA